MQTSFTKAIFLVVVLYILSLTTAELTDLNMNRVDVGKGGSIVKRREEPIRPIHAVDKDKVIHVGKDGSIARDHPVVLTGTKGGINPRAEERNIQVGKNGQIVDVKPIRNQVPDKASRI